MVPKPSVLLITMDELHREALSCYGATSHTTSNIDRLARQGVRYPNAYTSSPLCLPARCSLATGRFPHNTRSYSNILGAPLDAELPNLFTLFKANYYATAMIGKCHFTPVTYKMNRPDITQTYEQYLAYYRSLGIDYLKVQDGNQVSVWYYDDYAKELEEAGYHEAYRDEVWSRAGNHGIFPFPGPAEWHPDAWVGQQAVDYINAAQADGPICLWVSFSGPHYPMDAPEKYYDRIDMQQDRPRKFDEGDLQNERKIHHDSYYGPGGIDGSAFAADGACQHYDDAYWHEFRRAYYANVVQIDEYIGRVLEAAECTWGENLIVAFTADHGDMMGNHGLWGKNNCAYEDVFRVPLIVKYSGHTPGREVSANVQTTDLLPTFLAAAGLDAIPCDGRDLRALEVEGGWEYVLSEAENFVTITDGPLKYIECRKPAADSPTTYEELYDLRNDPDEVCNVIDSPEYADRLQKLKAVLARKQSQERLYDVLFYDYQGPPPWRWKRN